MASDIEVLAAVLAALHESKDNKDEISTVDGSTIQNHERSIQWTKDASAVM